MNDAMSQDSPFIVSHLSEAPPAPALASASDELLNAGHVRNASVSKQRLMSVAILHVTYSVATLDPGLDPGFGVCVSPDACLAH
jgi:hypothetical protein